MQASDFQWFKDNLQTLYEKYGNCFLAIKDKTVLGKYHSYAEGVKETAKVLPIGSFIVQECGETKDVYTNYIASFNFR